MSFIYETCAQVFSSARVFVGAEPSLSISKGLAIAGRLDYKIEAFKEEVSNFVDSDVLRSVIHDELDDLLIGICDRAFNEFKVSYASTLVSWREGEIHTMEDVQNGVNANMQESFGKAAFHSSLETVFKDWIKGLAGKLENITAELCESYGLKSNSIVLPLIQDVTFKAPNFNVTSASFIKGKYHSYTDNASLITGILTGGIAIGTIGVATASALVPVFTTLALIGIGALRLGIESYLKGKEDKLPLFARRRLMSDGEISKLVNEELDKTKENMFAEIKKQFIKPESFEEIVGSVKSALLASAEKASLLIR